MQLGAIDSQDPVSQTITTTKSTTPLRVDLDSNASLWYALRDVDSLTIRRILNLTCDDYGWGNDGGGLTARLIDLCRFYNDFG